MMPIRGVLLDLDGTLVDSNDAHAHAWQEALLENGFHVAYDKIRRCIMFRCGWQDRDLKGAIEIYDGPADLLAKYDKSELAKNRVAHR